MKRLAADAIGYGGETATFGQDRRAFHAPLIRVKPRLDGPVPQGRPAGGRCGVWRRVQAEGHRDEKDGAHVAPSGMKERSISTAV